MSARSTAQRLRIASGVPLTRRGALVPFVAHFLASLLWAGCGTSGTPGKASDALRAYDAVVANARRCAGEEKCLIAGGVKGCRCAVAVRRDAKAEVDQAARVATCPQVERLYCPPLENPRCEARQCVADQVRE